MDALEHEGLRSQLKERAPTFSPVVAAIADLRKREEGEEKIMVEFEKLLRDWLEKYPDTDIVILKYLMKSVLGSDEVVRMLVAVYEFEGLIIKTGAGLSGKGSYSASTKGTNVTIH